MTSDVKNMFDKEKLNQDLADKLRKEHPLQLITLIKMHLSFCLELPLSDENDQEAADKNKGKKHWLFHKKKASVCTSNAQNKSPELPILSTEMMKQLMTLINFLQKDENLMQEGIFRKTGSITRQQDLKFLINQLKPIKLDDSEYTAHDVASVLKSILSDLPEPILVEAYFPAYLQIADFCNSKETDKEDQIKTSLQLLFQLLPEENRHILERLVILLHNASQLESHNKMNSDSLATLFTPHLVVPRKLSPETLHQTAATMTRMISFMIQKGSNIFVVPEKLATDIKAYLVDEKRRKETPERILDESVSDSVAKTVFTFVDRKKTAEENVQSTTDKALAELYAHIQALPESSKKKKLIKQFNKQNGQGTPLQYLNRDKSSACRSIGDSIKKHIFHKTLNKTPKCSSTNTPSSSSKITKTPSVHTHPNKRILFQSPIATSKPSPLVELKSPFDNSTNSLSSSTSSSTSQNDSSSNSPKIISKPATVETTTSKKNDQLPQEDPLEMSQEEVIDDEDFIDSSDEEDQQQENVQQPIINRNLILPIDEMEHKSLMASGSERKSSTTFKFQRLIKGVSLGNLKFPFHSATPKSSPKLKKSKSSSILIDIEKDDEKRKLLMKSATESFNSSEESDLYFSMDHTKESWHVDISNINYFLNQTGMQDHIGGVRNSMSPITKSTQRMPKSMQESIMTPRSRKPVMLSMFGNSEKSYQTNISQLLEESEEVPPENDSQLDDLPISQASTIPISNILTQNSDDITNNSLNAANDNGLPTIAENGSSSSSGSLSSAFKDYLCSRGHQVYENDQDDYSFSSQSDDFESSSEYQKLEESREEVQSEGNKNESTESSSQEDVDIEKIINQSSMSKSLLHCLDGNELLSPQSSFDSRKRQLEEDEASPTESQKRPLIENDATDF